MLRVSEKELSSISLSPAEVSALLEVPERRVRKEIEHGLLPSPPVDFHAMVYLWVVHSLNDLEPSVEWRRSLLTSIRKHLVHSSVSSIPKELELVHGVSLHLRSLVEEVWERVFSFSRWCDRRVSSDPAVLGGEPVFRGSRLSVRRIGEAAELAGAVGELLEDYSYLKPEDIEFARRFVRAYPRVGRPRESAKAPTR
ncbi:MAG TPA: DUF433 domain-containing protein [Polyangia bacterium]|nr:DUF433 domain-containing protein [Polyangia bacterium]HVZ87585.1 DUF433 domain-containing protein [Polyangia bacterium]